jgi:glycosyltransferase involved in cell wall biosynthesis
MRACLEAIAAQTSPALEAIVVDNNSTDRTVDIAREYPFVRVVREPRQGVVFARNAGFDAVRGDVIGRIDADVQLPPNWVDSIQQFYTDAQNKKQAWTGCGRFYNIRCPRFTSWLFAWFVYGFNRLFTGHPSLWGSNMAILTAHWRHVRRSVHSQDGIHEDLDLAIHMHRAGYGITVNRDILVTAKLRRMRTDREQLWERLNWLSHTIRLHHIRRWPLAWFGGVFLLYQVTFLIVIAERLARLVGRPPLPD